MHDTEPPHAKYQNAWQETNIANDKGDDENNILCTRHNSRKFQTTSRTLVAYSIEDNRLE